jgi:hypothetical protein
VGSDLWVLLAHSVQQLAERVVHFPHVLDVGCMCMRTHVSSPERGADMTDAWFDAQTVLNVELWHAGTHFRQPGARACATPTRSRSAVLTFRRHGAGDRHSRAPGHTHLLAGRCTVRLHRMIDPHTSAHGTLFDKCLCLKLTAGCNAHRKGCCTLCNPPGLNQWSDCPAPCRKAVLDRLQVEHRLLTMLCYVKPLMTQGRTTTDGHINKLAHRHNVLERRVLS